MQAQIAEIQPTLTSSDASVTEWTYGETYDEDTSDVSGWSEPPQQRRRLNEAQVFSTVPTGQLFLDEENPGGSGIENQASASPPQVPQFENKKSPNECVICTMGLKGEEDDDYAEDAAWWCSGKAECRAECWCCESCKDHYVVCTVCRVWALVPASLHKTPTATMPQFPYEHEIQSCRGTGKKQEGLLCYAAATATAILWATQTKGKRDLSIYECMHLFATSGQAPSAFGHYFEAFVYLRKLDYWGKRTAGDIIKDVFLKDPEYRKILDAVCLEYGTPTFPADIPNQLHYQRIKTADLKKAITSDKPVIKGEETHWVVIFGIAGRGQDEITHITVYDPMRDSYETLPWDAATAADYYVVG
jgi:hypothetical protein